MNIFNQKKKRYCLLWWWTDEIFWQHKGKNVQGYDLWWLCNCNTLQLYLIKLQTSYVFLVDKHLNWYHACILSSNQAIFGANFATIINYILSLVFLVLLTPCKLPKCCFNCFNGQISVICSGICGMWTVMKTALETRCITGASFFKSKLSFKPQVYTFPVENVW